MNREQFIGVLQSALWSFEDMPEGQIYLHLGEIGYPKEVIFAGFKLANYLKQKEIKPK